MTELTDADLPYAARSGPEAGLRSTSSRCQAPGLEQGHRGSIEGLRGALRFARALLTHPAARRRVLAMRRTFRTHRTHLIAVAVVVRKPDRGTTQSPG